MSEKSAWIILAFIVLAGIAAYANDLRPKWGTSDTMPD